VPAYLPEVIPQDALECAFAKPGRCDNYPENWVHTKTCPFTIVALPVVGRYETLLDGVRSVCETGEAFLVPANREVSITHRFDPEKRAMASRWLHAHWTLFGAVDFTSLLALPPRLSREETKPLWDLIEEFLALEVRGGLPAAARKRELAFRALRLLTEVAPLREEALELLRGYERLQPAISYAREHLSGKVTVEQMARAAFLSPSRFHALFRAKIGSAPMQYVRELRIGEARRKLSATQMSIAEVAAAIGFANQFHFSREFKRATGLAPTAYRREHSRLEV
jgi:AraC-like DNA-binding protein